MGEQSIRHYLLRHSSGEGEVQRGKWVCAAHQPLCRLTHVLYWWGFRRRFERTRLTGYGIPLFTHSSPNLWSRWKWNEWNPFWSGEGVGGWLTECSVVYNHQGDSLGRGNKGMGIRRNRFCFWCMIREQQHRMMRKWENAYLRIGGNRCIWSSNHRSRFHWMIIEGYLHQSNTKSILSRITEPTYLKLLLLPLNSVNEGRSIHSSAYSISLRIVNVFLYL